MTSLISRRWAGLAFAAALLMCLAASLYEMRAWRGFLAVSGQDDLRNYYVASVMVLQHDSMQMFEGDGSPEFYARKYQDPNSHFSAVARSRGIDRTQFYTCPPFLADAMLPIGAMSFYWATHVWRGFSILVILLGGWALTRLMGVRWNSLLGLALIAGPFCLTALWQGYNYGQISPLLFALWSLGILFYARGQKNASALMLALGVLIKLTPLVVLLPILIWRDWKWVRWFCVWVAAGFVAMASLNGLQTVDLYFLHVMPAMSQGMAVIDNETISSVAGVFLDGRLGPAHAALVGKLISLLVLAACALPLLRRGRELAIEDRAQALASFALLSLCLSPIAWLDSYIIGWALLAILWVQAVRGQQSPIRLALLFATTCSIGIAMGWGLFYWRLDGAPLYRLSQVFLSVPLVLLSLYGLREGPAVSGERSLRDADGTLASAA